MKDIEKDILFVTTSMNNKWSEYSRLLVKRNFPNSEHLIVDGTNGWWQVWFKWIKDVENKTQKWIIHIDDDAFITNKDEILRLINILDDEGYSITGIPDGHNHVRGSNPVSINPFFMAIRRDHVVESWDWSLEHKFKTEWIEDYKHEYEKCFVDDFGPHKMSHDFCDLQLNYFSFVM